MKQQLTSALISLSFLAALPASGDDILDAVQALCEKVKACSMAQINEADMTPELRQMMEPMLENMCATMRAGVEEVPRGHPLYAQSVDCMRSMAALSCEDFQDEKKFATPSCKEYQETVQSYEGS